MSFQKTSDPNELKTSAPIVYFSQAYLQSQSHSSLQLFNDESYFIPLSINKKKAISIERSPFGSFLDLSKDSSDYFHLFEKEVVTSLKVNEIEELLIKHPSSIYPHFLDKGLLSKVGYQLLYEDINQHIALDDEWQNRLHDMQSRKLKSLEKKGFEFKQISLSEIEVVHQFLTVCRQAQGLEINISLEKLKFLCENLPNTYDFFGTFRRNKLSAVCIAVRVTESIAYYYLAGTSPLFRSHSPMVLLIAGMVAFYRQLGFQYFDLGVSSFEGRPQETLRLFKERMGAIETKKPFLRKGLS